MESGWARASDRETERQREIWETVHMSVSVYLTASSKDGTPGFRQGSLGLRVSEARTCPRSDSGTHTSRGPCTGLTHAAFYRGLDNGIGFRGIL